MKKLFSILPHLTIALALFLITCFIVDRYNRAMAFINNDFTKYTLLVFAILVIVESVVFILRDRRQRKEAQKPKDAQPTDSQKKNGGEDSSDSDR